MTHNIYLYIFIMAGVSYAIRVLPLTLIKKPIENEFLKSFLYYVPYVTLAVMTFPGYSARHRITAFWCIGADHRHYRCMGRSRTSSSSSDLLRCSIDCGVVFMSRTNDLGQDRISRLVIRLAIPTMLAQLVNVLYSIVDRMYIGTGVGSLALAGVGVCAPIVTLLTSFGSMVGQGGAPIMAMQMGSGDHKSAKQTLNNGFFMLLVLSAVLTGLFLLTKDQLLMWFGASEATFSYANTYVTIYTAGTFFALISGGLNSFLIAQGFSGLGMATVVLGAVLNIILDPVFIFIFHMGVAGAAIATVISQMASCAFVLLSLRSHKMPVRLGWGGFQASIIRRIVTFGFSPFLILASDSILLIVLNTVLQKYGGPGEGDTLVTCATIVQSYLLLITMPMGGTLLAVNLW